MDAMDGYEQAGLPTLSTFDDLDSKLQQRIDKAKRGRVIPWRYLAVAASLLIVFSIGWLLWPTKQSPMQKQELTAARITPPGVDHQPVTTADTITKPEVKRQLMASLTRPYYKQAPQKEVAPVVSQATPPQTTQLEEKAANSDAKVGVTQPAFKQEAFFKNKRDSVTLKEVAISGLAKLTQKDIEANPTADKQTLQSKVNGVDITRPQKINGTILNDLGMAMPGVAVKLQGTDIETLTDEKGRFSLPANGQSTLDIEQSGYAARHIAARADDSLKIALEPNNASLAEVVATKSKPVKKAHPQMGTDAYKKYIQSLAISADGVDGTVALSFSVSVGEGQRALLGDFKIIKGLSNATNQQAINLVKNGPAWAPDVSGKPQTIELKIKFSKKK